MKYIVSVAIDGRIDVEVDADSFEAAKNLVYTNISNIDLKNMDYINFKAVNAEDEAGTFVDY